MDINKILSIKLPCQIVLGEDSVHSLPGFAGQLHAEKALIVTDPSIYRCGLVRRPAELLKKAGLSVSILNSVPSEPEIGQILSLYHSIEDWSFGMLVGIGGGSVMDVTKILAVLATNQGYETNLLEAGKIINDGIPTVMMPTTAGTGSEATINAVVKVPEKELKVGIVCDRFMPHSIILDPSMTQSMPKSITASTGMDAFCHAIECYTSKKANPVSDALALRAISLISENLVEAYRNGSDSNVRLNMMAAALMGGICISSSGTTAVHALAYPLGGKFRIPHGVSNAILLPSVMEFNMDAVEDRLFAVAKAMGIDTSELDRHMAAEKVVESIQDMENELHIDRSLRPYGVTREDLPEISTAAYGVRRLLDNNMKPMTVADIQSIYQKLL